MHQTISEHYKTTYRVQKGQVAQTNTTPVVLAIKTQHRKQITARQHLSQKFLTRADGVVDRVKIFLPSSLITTANFVVVLTCPV